MTLLRVRKDTVINVDQISDIAIRGRTESPLCLITMCATCCYSEEDDDAPELGPRIVGLDGDDAVRFLKWLEMREHHT